MRECHVSSGFQCSREPSIQAFFLEQAWAQELGGQTRTYVMVPSSTASSTPRVLGFYSLCASRILATEVQGSPFSGGPAQIPVILIGQLGRDDMAPKGVGAGLMAGAFRTILEASTHIGVAGVVLDAKNESLVGYYQRFGFEKIKRSGSPQKMFLALETIRSAETDHPPVGE
jgi:hypothetical protein